MGFPAASKKFIDFTNLRAVQKFNLRHQVVQKYTGQNYVLLGDYFQLLIVGREYLNFPPIFRLENLAEKLLFKIDPLIALFKNDELE